MKYPLQERERGGCLTIWLLVNALFAVLALPLLVGASNELDSRFDSSIVFGIIIMIAYLVFIYGAWNWKRWGVYGLVITALVSNGSQILSGIQPGRNIVQLVVQLAILFFLVSSRWDDFE